MEMQAQGVQEYVVFFFFSIHDFPSYFNKVLLTVLLCQIAMWIQVIFYLLYQQQSGTVPSMWQ